MEFFKNTNFDFIGKGKIAYIISLSLIVLGVVAMIARGGLNLSIDFIGGTLVQMKIQPMPPIDEVRGVLIENGLKSAQIQQFAQSNDIIIRMKKGEIPLTEEVRAESPARTAGETSPQAISSEGETGSPRMGVIGKKFYDMFSLAFPQAQIEILRTEMVGPSVGKKLLRQAIFALFWGMIGIMVYVGWRFEFKYSAPAVLALFHDIFIVISIFALLDKEIDMTVIAAILTVVGYSINDTIVIYDRIREKIRLFARDEIGKVMNIAINDTLGRTIITGLTTAFVLFSIFFLGGEVIHNFAFALLVGIGVGTYSSIFISSSLVYEWEIRHRRIIGK